MGPVPSSIEHKKTGFILCLSVISIFGGSIPDAFGQQSQKSKTRSASEWALARRELNSIGEKIATALLHKDIPTLLSYDRQGLRPEAESTVTTTKLYHDCFLFDSS